MPEKVVVLDAISERTAVRLRDLLPPGMELTHAHGRDEAHLRELIADADFAISGQIAVNAAVLRAAKNLKLLLVHLVEHLVVAWRMLMMLTA